jgi:hypothetical protein
VAELYCPCPEKLKLWGEFWWVEDKNRWVFFDHSALARTALRPEPCSRPESQSGRLPSQASEQILQNPRDTQGLRTIRQRPTNTRKRSNLNSHLISTPTTRTSLFEIGKNIYVSA